MMDCDTSASGLRWISRHRAPAEINPYGLVLRFPSPRPSPLGRGRILRRLSAKPSAISAPHTSQAIRTAAGCSLSPGERVRVRGNYGLQRRGVAAHLLCKPHRTDARWRWRRTKREKPMKRLEIRFPHFGLRNSGFFRHLSFVIRHSPRIADCQSAIQTEMR